LDHFAFAGAIIRRRFCC